ncbi:hypothetical protein D805_1649 [Bifidobacterium thermophilum RBL67]|uniref:Uncharacterized protein n=2 Tax=Bifidobacterium thermophilum TaxID=33905 RepID=M4REF6_9BIFI|nr:hypothetical protein D805_1649 [Bifidobacterium thermophilum RBL67]
MMAKNKNTKKAFDDINFALVNIIFLLILLVSMIPRGEWVLMAFICVLMLLNIAMMITGNAKKNTKQDDNAGKAEQIQTE